MSNYPRKIALFALLTLSFYMLRPAATLAQTVSLPQPVAEGTVSGATNPAAMNPADATDLQLRLSKIDQMVQGQMAEQNLPGYSLAIIKDGTIVFQKSYGYADLSKKRPVDSDTVFGLASVTKTFTAIALLSLVDQGLVNLDDPVGKYVEGLSAPYDRLTIRQLASMSAGVPSVLAQEVAWREQLPILVHTPLASTPGSQFLYSNFSYRLLGSVIEKASGRPYLDYVSETILQPLKMSSTATTELLNGSGRVAQGYGDGGGRLRAIEYKNPAVSFSAGMLATTQNDMIKYALGMLDGKMLSPQAYKTLWLSRPPLATGLPCPWAFGWNSKKLDNGLKLAMQGGTAGVASTIILFPQSHSAVIALANLRKPSVYAIGKQAAAIAFNSAGSADAAAESGESSQAGSAEAE